MSSKAGLYEIDQPYFHAVSRGDGTETRGNPNVFLGHKISRGKDRPPDGVFATWRWDGQCLRVENDRYGFYPLYYFANEVEVCISPSLVRLIGEGAPDELDYPALAVFLRLGFFVGDDTPFEAIRAVPPGADFAWARGRFRVRGNPFLVQRQSLSRDAAIDAYISLFRQAMELRRPKDDNFILPLSGGRDSRHILLELCRMKCAPRRCVTSYKYPTLSSRRPDASIAPMLARRLNVSHSFFKDDESPFRRELTTNIVLNMCVDEPAWIFALYDYINKNSPVCYDGIAALLSHSTYVTREPLCLFEQGHWEELADYLFRQWSKGPSISRLLGADRRDKLDGETAAIRVLKELKRHAGAANPLLAFYFWNRTRREVALAPLLLLKDVEAAYMPYLDHQLCDFLLSLPPDMTIDRKLHSDTIHRAFPQYSSIPFSRDVKLANSQFSISIHRIKYFTDFVSFVLQRRSDWLSLDSHMLLRNFLRHFHPARARLASHLLPTALYLLQLEYLAKEGAADLGVFGCRLAKGP